MVRCHSHRQHDIAVWTTRCTLRARSTLNVATSAFADSAARCGLLICGAGRRCCLRRTPVGPISSELVGAGLRVFLPSLQCAGRIVAANIPGDAIALLRKRILNVVAGLSRCAAARRAIGFSAAGRRSNLAAVRADDLAILQASMTAIVFRRESGAADLTGAADRIATACGHQRYSQ